MHKTFFCAWRCSSEKESINDYSRSNRNLLVDQKGKFIRVADAAF